MNKENIEVGKNYHIEFLGDWSSFNGDYQISLIITPDAVTALDASKSIRSIFFTDIGIDVNMYDMYIKPSTLVFASYPITSKNPLKIGNDKEENMVYLPASLIDYDKSYQFLDGVQMNFKVSTGIKYFSSLTDKDDFIKSELVDIKSMFDKNNNFSGETISVSVDQNDALTTQSEINDILSAREKSKKNIENAKKQYQLNMEASERNLYERVKEMETARDNYTSLSSNLYSKINDTEALRIINEQEATLLNKVKEYMIKMLSMLITGEITVGSLGNSGSEAFENLYERAKESL